MSQSRAKCGYVGSFVNACDAIPQAIQRIVSYEHESRMRERDTRDFITRTVESFRGSSRRGGDSDSTASPQIEEDMQRLKAAFEAMRKEYREKVSLAEQAQHVLDEWRKNLNDAHASKVETTTLMELAKTDPRQAAELLDKGLREIAADRPYVQSGIVLTVVNEDKTPTSKPVSKAEATGTAKTKPKAASAASAKSTAVAQAKPKVAKRPASDKPAAAPPSKKPKVSQSSQQGQDQKQASKKTESTEVKKKKKTKKSDASKSEEGWMRNYKQGMWKGVGKLPPLCGPVPAMPAYIIPAGNFVAAKNPTKAGEAPSWMVATVVKYSQTRRAYEVEDVDADEAKANKKGNKMIIPKDSVIPLPLQMPDFTLMKEFPVGRKVIALYPKTTCFYEGKVVHTPSMLKANYYLVEFVDDDDEDEEGGKRVAHALVLDYPNFTQKPLSF